MQTSKLKSELGKSRKIERETPKGNSQTKSIGSSSEGLLFIQYIDHLCCNFRGEQRNKALLGFTYS